MKILIVNITDSGGGAAKASYRLCKTLNDFGVKSDMYVKTKTVNDDFVKEIYNKGCNIIYTYKSYFDNKIMDLFFSTTNKIYHSTNNYAILNSKIINKSDYDLVHLHWINGYVSNKTISKISKPIVWTLHDSWPFCGAEHHPNLLENDSRYKDGYYIQNKPSSTKGFDLCRYEWEKKNSLLKNKKITFIAPSTWEKKLLKESKLFGNNYCEVIPNILPFNIFFLKDKNKTRLELGLPLDKKIIGFAAAYQLDDPDSMKGTFYFINALKIVQNNDELFILIIGPSTKEFTSQLPINCISTGYINDEMLISKYYSCCDVYVNSSLIENLSYTTYEALACGVPVVAFNGSGQDDLIMHKKNGYIAQLRNVTDLAYGVNYCLNNNMNSEIISNDIQVKFSEENIIRKHISLYEKVLEE